MARRIVSWALGPVAVVLTIAPAFYWSQGDCAADAEPRTLEEAASRAEALGLFCRSDARDEGYGNRLVISDRPVSWQRATLVCLGDLRLPCWVGTVAVSTDWTAQDVATYHEDFHSGRVAIWGSLFVCGDREIIRKLLSER